MAAEGGGRHLATALAERVRACRDLELLGRLARRAAVIASAEPLLANA